MANSYDLMPYRTKPRRMTHPETYASLAALLGLDPPDIRTARVLEIGCGTGGNMIAMAWALPDAEFVGVDPSAVQIDLAREEAARFGLKNTVFEPIGVENLPDGRPFDYIVCHGVFAWVPVAIQDQIFECCRQHLSPHGVAMISYNTYPGWHLRAISRDALNYFVPPEDDPPLKVAKARSYLKFLAEAVPDRESTIAKVLMEEKEILDNCDDFYIFHEHLEETNAPLYFKEFARRARQHGLQYLGDAGRHWQMTGLSEETQKILKHISRDDIDLEQHLDFIRNRAFRHSLLMREGVTIGRDFRLTDSVLARAACRTEPMGEAISLKKTHTYVSIDGVEMTTASPLMHAVLDALIDCFPKAMALPRLRQAVAERFAVDFPEDAEEAQSLVERGLFELSHGGFVTLHVWQADFTIEVSERPEAWPIARHIAKDIRVIPTLTHQSINVNPLEGWLLHHCDGRRSIDDLVKVAAEGVERGVVPQPEMDLPKAVAVALDRLSTCAVLVR